LIEAAYQAGLRHFGENRVEEAKGKIETLREHLPDDVVWHMVGHVQSRKTTDVVLSFQWVHSVDRFKVARRLSDTATQSGQTLDVLLEVNVSGEASKYGYDLSNWPDDPAQGETFHQEVKTLLDLPGIKVHGLMVMAPYTTEPETVRPIFSRLRELRSWLAERFPEQSWPHLSMGMSGDFEVAVEEGATMVRLGTAIFGAREY
jgi:pyridoxal phosphate enzyme (YggS family)